MNLVANTDHVDWSKISLGNINFWSKLHLCGKIFEECSVSTTNAIFASYEKWRVPHHCHSQHLVFVQGMGLMTHFIRKVGFSLSKDCGVYHEVGYDGTLGKCQFRRIFHFKKCIKTHFSSTNHMPYPLFKKILFHKMHPWTEVLLLSVLHICGNQEWQLFSVCCHVQDQSGA